MRRTQKLSTGFTIRQDFRQSARLVFFEHPEFSDYPYSTTGGTAFLVSMASRYFGITCRHILGSYQWKQLVFTNRQVGKLVSGIRGVYEVTDPGKSVAETDINDIIVIDFDDDCGGRFFGDEAYHLDPETVGRSEIQDQLQVYGFPRAQVLIGENEIGAKPHLFEFEDIGQNAYDSSLRTCHAEYENPLPDLAGLSGAPVFSVTQNRLVGMVVRGGFSGRLATAHFVDFFDISQMLSAILDGHLYCNYLKPAQP